MSDVGLLYVACKKIHSLFLTAIDGEILFLQSYTLTTYYMNYYTDYKIVSHAREKDVYDIISHQKYLFMTLWNIMC